MIPIDAVEVGMVINVIAVHLPKAIEPIDNDVTLLGIVANVNDIH